jgi:hypothetical protein
MLDLDNADYLHLMPIKEKRRKAKELAAETDKESRDEETPPGTPGPGGNEIIQDEWKDIKKYIFDMRDLGQFMRINLKLSVKQVAKKSPKPSRCDRSVWGALVWEGLEKNLHDIPIHPCISCMCRALFSWETKTPLQTLMVAVNIQSTLDSMSETVSKKELVESLGPRRYTQKKFDIRETGNEEE